MILVDSNVLIDVLEDDQQWRAWSIGQIAEQASYHRLIINPIILAEVAPRTGSLETFHREIAAIGVEIEALSDEGAFAAGLAFQAYRRRRGGGSKSVLPDFFIGGHAASVGANILTRDVRFYEQYFPGISLIAPQKDNDD